MTHPLASRGDGISLQSRSERSSLPGQRKWSCSGAALLVTLSLAAAAHAAEALPREFAGCRLEMNREDFDRLAIDLLRSRSPVQNLRWFGDAETAFLVKTERRWEQRRVDQVACVFFGDRLTKILFVLAPAKAPVEEWKRIVASLARKHGPPIEERVTRRKWRDDNTELIATLDLDGSIGIGYAHREPAPAAPAPPAPQAVVPPGATSGTDVEATAGSEDPTAATYTAIISERVRGLWEPPGQGRVVVNARVLRSRYVRDVVVVQPSGNPLFDMSAVRAIQEAVPYPPFPPLMREEYVDITLTFTGKEGLR